MKTTPRYQKAWATNANTSSFASKIPTTTEPTNDGVTSFFPGTPRRVMILPYGLGSDDDVFDMRIIGWRGTGEPATRLWVPTIIANFTCTISSAVGIAGAFVLNTERFADTIALKTDNVASQPTFKGADNAGVMSMGDIQIFTPTGNVVGYIIMPVLAYEKIEITFDQTTGTPTMNCLLAFLDE